MKSTPQSHPSTALNQSRSHMPHSLPRSLRYFLFAILGLTIICLAYSWVARWLGFGLPYSFPGLFVPHSFLSDFSQFRERFYLFGTPALFLPHRRIHVSAGNGVAARRLLLHRPSVLAFLYLRPCFRSLLHLLFLPSLAQPGTHHSRGDAFGSWRGYHLLSLRVSSTTWEHGSPHLDYRHPRHMEFLPRSLRMGSHLFRSRHRPQNLSLHSLWSFPAAPALLEMVLGGFITVAVTLIALRALSPNIGYALTWDLNQLQDFGKYYAAFPPGWATTTHSSD